MGTSLKCAPIIGLHTCLQSACAIRNSAATVSSNTGFAARFETPFPS